MTALNFPSSPALNDTFTAAGRTWQWNGTAWLSVIGSLDADLAAIGALTGTSGYLKKTAANTWSLDTLTYLATTGGTMTGDVAFSGTGLRFKGDFSNNTLASRLLFQDVTTNSPSAIGVMPNGTGNIATWQSYNSSDLANTGSMLIGITSTEVTLRSSKYGTASYLPVTVYTSDTKRLEIGIDGTSTFSNGVTVNAIGSNNGVSATSAAGSGYGGYFKNVDSGANIEFFAAASLASNRLFSGKNGGTEKVYADATGNMYSMHYTEGVNTANSGSAYTIDLANGSVQNVTLTASCTFTMPTATAGKSFVMYLKTGAGSFTASFTNVKWAGGTAPTITTTGARMDMLSFFADGTNWYGVVGGQVYTP